MHNCFRCMFMHVGILRVKEQTCTLLINTRYGGRNCNKSVLKPLTAKNDVHGDYPPFLCTMQSIYTVVLPFPINWNGKQCIESTY